MGLKIRTQASVDAEEDVFRSVCKSYCDHRIDAEKAKMVLQKLGYGALMAEKHINQWDAMLDQSLSYSNTFVRGGAL